MLVFDLKDMQPYRLEVENLLATSWRTRRIGRDSMEVVEVETKMRRRNGESGRMRATGRPVSALIAGTWEKYILISTY